MSHREDVEQYVEGVLSGEIVAGRHVVSACRRYLLDIENADDKEWFFDEETVCLQIDFMESLKHTKGAQWAGTQFKLSPSQKFIVWNVLGFRLKKTIDVNGVAVHPRRFRQCYATVARKWGKSTWVSILVACLLFFDFPIEVEAELYATATKEDQAKRIVTQVANTIKREPELISQAECYKYKETVTSVLLPKEPYNGSYLKALGSDSKTLDALNPHVDVRDEIHEWKKQHLGMWEKMETGSGSRIQPLSLVITTAGDENSQIWIQFDSYCAKVLESAVTGQCIDDEVFVFIARLDEARPCECGGADADCSQCGGKGEIPGDDPYDESVWQKSNPDIGQTPSWDQVRGRARKAKNEKAYESSFIRYQMNSKVRSNQKCIHPKLWANLAIEMGVWSGNCFGGWDVGTRDDLAGVAVVKKMDDGTFQGRSVALCPEEGVRDLTREPWASWIRDGLLIVTPGETLQMSAMEQVIRDWTEDYGVTEWAFDERHSLQMAQNLDADGIETVSFKQSYMMYNEPMREFLAALAGEQFFHDGNALLAYCAGNLSRKERDGLWMPDKMGSEDKIDPIVAMIMAFARASFSQPPTTSIYQRRGSLAV